MPENQEVKHITVNGKYRVVFEKAASANKIDGFKIEANGDNIKDVMIEAQLLYADAIRTVEANKPIVQPIK